MELPFENPRLEWEGVLDAVFFAGKAILEVYGEDFAVEMKGENDPLTQADLQSNEILKKVLLQSAYVLSEEDKDDLVRLDFEKVWIIDPLDGTKEFIDRNGEFAIMIGLVVSGLPVIGIVYQPTADLLYVAQKGEGVFERITSGWKRLKGSNHSVLSDFRAVVSRSHLSGKSLDFLKYLGVENYTQKGSAGVKAGEICRGNAEFYFNPSDKLKQWDTCALYCMLAEIGGRVTDMLGNELEYNVAEVNHLKGILVSNGRAHEEIVRRWGEFNQS